MQLKDLKNKKIGIIGFGIEGRAVAQFLNSNAISFDIFDRDASLDFEEFPESKKFLGSSYLQNLEGYDVLFRSPGVKFFPEILAAQKNGAVLTSQIKYFFDNCPGKIIGVTGTKGKGTTATLLYKMLSAAGFRTFIGGNLGTEILNLLGQLKNDDFVVLELSSFQLADLQKSPHLAIVLMVTSEHQDYHNDVEEYIQAKTAITNFQGPEDLALINIDFQGSRKIGELGQAKKYYIHTTGDAAVDIKQGIVADKTTGKIEFVEHGQYSEFLKISELLLPGYHNVQNIAAASLAAKLLGVDLELIKKVARDFSGYEHRLEFVTERAGIKFYNDSSGASIEACLAAVDAFTQNEILILGGFDKKGDYADLCQKLSERKNIKAVVVIGQIAETLVKNLKNSNLSGQILSGAADLSEAFEQIGSVAEAGDIVLLAPATSSFDWFKNYKDRGDQFKKLAMEF